MPKKATSKRKKPKAKRKKGLSSVSSGVGKGYKSCVNCGKTIPARSATCKKCNFTYSFKGKPR